jgi:hypothetical protein
VKAFVLYRGQNSRPHQPVERRAFFRTPYGGGGSAWGVAQVFPFFAPARAPEVFGPTPLPNPPPQGGRELETEA